MPAYPEIPAAITRRHKAKEIETDAFERIKNAFKLEWASFVAVEFHKGVFEFIDEIIARYALKGPDSVDLSSALWLGRAAKENAAFEGLRVLQRNARNCQEDMSKRYCRSLRFGYMYRRERAFAAGSDLNENLYEPNFSRKRHRRLRNLFNILLALALVAILVAYFLLRTTPIGKIIENPREYAGKTVVVSGTVKDEFSLVFVQYFILADKTGSIPVVTHEPLPRVGAKLRVRGTVREAFSLGDKQLMVLVEHEKK